MAKYTLESSLGKFQNYTFWEMVMNEWCSEWIGHFLPGEKNWNHSIILHIVSYTYPLITFDVDISFFLNKKLHSFIIPFLSSHLQGSHLEEETTAHYWLGVPRKQLQKHTECFYFYTNGGLPLVLGPDLVKCLLIWYSLKVNKSTPQLHCRLLKGHHSSCVIIAGVNHSVHLCLHY